MKRLYGWKLGLELSLLTKKKRRENILRNARSGAGRPATIESIRAKHPMSKEQFYNEIGSIFPLILEMTSMGYTIAEIEEALGFHDQFIKRVLNYLPKLRELVQEARKTKLDDAHFQ
jgi:hypothetical protein